MTAQEYTESLTTPSDDVLDVIERWSHLHTAQPQMICGSYEGRLLTMLARTAGARCAVEIGAFVGYSSICIARGLAKDGILYTFEVNEEQEQHIRRHLEAANLSERVELHIGDAKKMLPDIFENVKSKVDFAFIDAGKRQNKTFYDLVMPLMRSGGIIVIDNTLWGGKVLDTELYNDADTKAVDDFNNYVHNDPRVENIMLSVRDGVLICSVL